ncbi:acyl-CoA dehydrogenase family protein [Nocardia sp. NPDC052278]|uniref:acyl-CoA dehydrogenase family protein n=1 Tax=unclassified Nocardia TaxID=2637762 RepID=UPI0036B16982
MGGRLMDYQFSEEHDAFRAMLADLCAAKANPRASYDNDVSSDLEFWRELASVGVAGLAIPEEFDGSGAGVIEQVVVAEELGRAVAPVPYLGHTVAAFAIDQAGDSDQRKQFLGPLARGEVIGAYVPTGAGIGPVTVTARAGSRWRLEGSILWIVDAVAAGVLVLPAHTDDGVRWFVVRDPVLEPLPSIDRTRPLATLHLSGCDAELLCGAQHPEEVADRSLALLRTLAAAEAAGVAARVLDLSSAYTKQRHQFGLPIGTFQAVKHRLADMLVEVENSRSAVYGAAWAIADGHDPVRAVAMAQAVATANAVDVVGSAIQLHGGIGVTWENDLHIYLRRAKALQLAFGASWWHLERLAQLLLDEQPST